ncbi:MAG: 3'-5' exonuclease [Ilumatobacteraceae bacterium]
MRGAEPVVRHRRCAPDDPRRGSAGRPFTTIFASSAEPGCCGRTIDRPRITEAARDYLTAGIAEDLQPDEQSYVHTGGAAPAVRQVADTREEADLVARFLQGATRELRLTVGSGAVLVPDKYVGEPLADALEDRGIPAEYRNSREFELDDNSISILPLTAAKGLEFPVVAVAGFGKSNWPHLEDLDGDAEIEALVKARRTLFVAMTRAMRALLVVTPSGHDSMLYDGFDPELWNTA